MPDSPALIKTYILHVHTGGGKEYNMHVHNCGKGTPCTSRLLEVERNTLHVHIAGEGGGGGGESYMPCASIDGCCLFILAV
jgi:hypothetical protein